MAALIDWLFGPLGAVLAGVVAFVGAWLAGKRSGAHKAEREADKAYIERRRRMDDVQMGDDTDALREWMRQRDPDSR